MQGAMRALKGKFPGSLITQHYPDVKKEVWLQSKYYFRGKMHSYYDPFVHT